MKKALLALFAVIAYPILAEDATRRDDGFVMRVRTARQEGKDVITQHGTCVAVDLEDCGRKGARWLLTVAHVVDAKVAIIMVETTKDGWISCRTRKIDPKLDLALLEASEDMPARCRLEQSEIVSIVASSEGKPVTTQKGMVTNSEVACDMAQGMSGGGVFKEGKLSGIVSAIIAKDGSKTGVVISANMIRAFLGE